MEFLSKEFDDAVVGAIADAVQETLRAGVPVFYKGENGLEIMQLPDGRRFQIRFIPHEMDQCNYEVVREIRSAA